MHMHDWHDRFAGAFACQITARQAAVTHGVITAPNSVMIAFNPEQHAQGFTLPGSFVVELDSSLELAPQTTCHAQLQVPAHALVVLRQI
jgi:hypothetical protein